MAWFQKKIEIEVPDGKGGTRRVKIAQKDFDRWKAERRIEHVRTEIFVHVLDPMRPTYTTTWVLGKDIDEPTYEKRKHTDGHLYALIHYVDGKPSLYLAPKAAWDQAKAAMGALSTEDEIAAVSASFVRRLKRD